MTDEYVAARYRNMRRWGLGAIPDEIEVCIASNWHIFVAWAGVFVCVYRHKHDRSGSWHWLPHLTPPPHHQPPSPIPSKPPDASSTQDQWPTSGTGLCGQYPRCSMATLPAERTSNLKLKGEPVPQPPLSPVASGQFRPQDGRII